MSRAIQKLTPERARYKSKQVGLYGDGGGLYLCVKSKGAASWVFRYMLNGKAREMGLGPYPAVALQKDQKDPNAAPGARELAEDARKLKARGLDPIEARAASEQARKIEAAKTLSFRACTERYIAAHSENWRNAKHAAQWTATLNTYAMPILADIAVGSVDRALIIRVLDPIWKTKAETARRVRGRMEAVIDWATAMEFRQGDNPARYKGPLQKIFPTRKGAKVEHHPALPYAEMSAFMASLKEENGLGAAALQFTILTAARTGEVIGARWPEIDLDKALWTVPASRMKTGREHRVPLSKPALTLLRKLRELSDGKGFIFPGKPKKHLSNMAMLATLRRMERSDITAHGFRSTFRDWVEESTSYAGTVAEAALAHTVGDKVEAAYRRGDLFEKRRKLMAAWATFCTSPAKEAEVIPIGRKPRMA